MNNSLVSNSVNLSNLKSNISVNNSTCIVCNNQFSKPRNGKLYCSNRCKQIGYNRKQRLIPGSDQNSLSNNQETIELSTKEYTSFLKLNTKHLRLKELARRKRISLEEEKRIDIKRELRIEPDQNSIFNYYYNELNYDDEVELQNLEKLIPNAYSSRIYSLSLEQWSFLKILFNGLNNIKLYLVICQLSQEFINQLDIEFFNKENSKFDLSLHRKFIQHYNDLSEGKIKFK